MVTENDVPRSQGSDKKWAKNSEEWDKDLGANLADLIMRLYNEGLVWGCQFNGQIWVSVPGNIDLWEGRHGG